MPFVLTRFQHCCGLEPFRSRVCMMFSTLFPSQEMEALKDEAELKAGAAREGIAAADAQTLKATEEGNSLR